jgi:hypothetical protein
MNQFIANLIPRLRQYGQQLSKIESFVDKTWCLKDEHDRLRTYRFKRNNTLRVSIAGNFADMHWELEGLDALAISSHGGKSGEIYRHGFVFDGLLIVQKEGTGEMPKIFYDESKVPDGDVLGYIRRELISRMGLRNLNATSNLFVTNSGDVSGGIYVGQQVYDHNIQLVKNQTIKEGDKIIFVRNGLIEKIITIVNMVTDYGEIQVHTKFGEPGIGDFVYMHGTPLQSGRYIAKANSSSYNIDVANGSITKVFESIWTSQKVLLILLVVVILTVFMIAVNQKNNPAEAVIDVKDTGQVQEPIDTAALSVDT